MPKPSVLPFVPLNDDQLRFFNDAKSHYQSWWPAAQEARQYNYWLGWRERHGVQYLTRSDGGGVNQKSLGARSPSTEAVYNHYVSKKQPAKTARRLAENAIADRSRLLKAAKLARLNSTYGKVLREFELFKILGANTLIVGPSAMLAYESLAGVHFDKALLGIDCLDVVWIDSSRGMEVEGDRPTLLDILVNADKTFTNSQSKAYKFKNAKDQIVQFSAKKNNGEYAAFNQGKNIINPNGIEAAQWMNCVPSVTAITIDTAGWPVRVVAPDPRVFLLFSLWASQQAEINENIQSLELARAQAIATLLKTHLKKFPFNSAFLKRLPKELSLVWDQGKLMGND